MQCFWVLFLCSVLVSGYPTPEEKTFDEESLEKNEAAAPQLSNTLRDRQYQNQHPSGATASAGVKRSSGYSKRSAAVDVDEVDSEEVQGEEQDNVEVDATVSGKRDFGDVLRILNIAGTGPKAVDFSGSYSGRRKRSPQIPVHASAAEGQEENAEAAPLEAQPDDAEGGQRNFGDIARILAIAGTGPKAVDFSGSYTGRRRRSPQLSDQDVDAVNLVEQMIGSVYSELLAEAKHQKVAGSLESRRSKRSDRSHGLVPEVAPHAVKIKSRGKHGNIVHEAEPGVTLSRVVFDSASHGRKRRSDFIPFSEYDQNRVKTLKIEQNDFLALPQRLNAKTTTAEENSRQTERRKRKFHNVVNV